MSLVTLLGATLRASSKLAAGRRKRLLANLDRLGAQGVPADRFDLAGPWAQRYSG